MIESTGDSTEVTKRNIAQEEVYEVKQSYLTAGGDRISTQEFPDCDINFECVSTTAAKGRMLFGVCASWAGGSFRRALPVQGPEL
jgi:hypothetical protein